MPESDRLAEQALENPRIVVTENLKELPRVKVVDSGEADSTAKAVDPALEELQQLEQELNIDSKADKIGSALLDGSDKLMDSSRRETTTSE